MRVRRADAADFAAIRAVELSAGELFAETHMSWAVGETTGVEDLAEAASEGLLWVAEAGNAVAGFLLAGAVADQFVIYEVAVDQRHRGKRIGAALVDAGCSEAGRRGYEFAILTTDRTLPWNGPWYARLGFRVLADAEIPPEIARMAAVERNPQLRCVMRRTVDRSPRSIRPAQLPAAARRAR